MGRQIKGRSREIPISFLKENLPIDFDFISWMYLKGFLDGDSLIELACAQVEMGKEEGPLMELCALSSGDAEEVKEIAAQCMTDESKDSDYIQRIIYLELRMVVGKSQDLESRLKGVESVYSDYGYPGEISHLVRYMPSVEAKSEQDLDRLLMDYLENFNVNG